MLGKVELKEVADFPKYAVTSNGQVYSHHSGKFLKLHLGQRDGYFFVRLKDRSRSRTFQVHRLIALAFVAGYRPGLQVNHKDGDKTNNNRINLEWVTRSQNSLHSYSLGLSKQHKIPVKCTTTGQSFSSMLAAALALKIPVIGVSSCINGKQKSTHGFQFCRC